MSNARQPVPCSHCGAALLRRPMGPRGPIAHFFCDRDCKGEWQREQNPITREWLHQKYVVEGLSTYAIGRLVGRDSTRVHQWLVGFGIPTRPRGSVHEGSFRKGQRPRLGIPHSEATKAKIRAARFRDGRVPYLKNGVHHLKGKRGADVPSWRGGLTPERQAFYRSDEWKRACAAVWRRANACCERCGLNHRKVDRRRTKFHVHHVVSFQVRELRAELSNLALLCERCHRFVHSRANVSREFLRDREDHAA